MDPARRTLIAAAARDAIPDLERGVVESWSDTWPASNGWSAERRRRATAAARVTLEGIVTVFQHGDLDDRSWASARESIYARVSTNPDDADELVRSVRIVGIDALLRYLGTSLRISPDERWTFEQSADAFCSQVRGAPDDIDPAAIDQLLTTMQAESPDIS